MRTLYSKNLAFSSEDPLNFSHNVSFSMTPFHTTGFQVSTTPISVPFYFTYTEENIQDTAVELPIPADSPSAEVSPDNNSIPETDVKPLRIKEKVKTTEHTKNSSSVNVEENKQIEVIYDIVPALKQGLDDNLSSTKDPDSPIVPEEAQNVSSGIIRLQKITPLKQLLLSWSEQTFYGPSVTSFNSSLAENEVSVNVSAANEGIVEETLPVQIKKVPARGKISFLSSAKVDIVYSENDTAGLTTFFVAPVNPNITTSRTVTPVDVILRKNGSEIGLFSPVKRRKNAQDRPSDQN